jgi:hypothetical protein
MAAATVSSSTVHVHGGMITQHVTLSVLTADQTESIAVNTGLGAPDKVAPFEVEWECLTPATSADPVSMSRVYASDSTTGNTVAVKFTTPALGDITGAVVKVKLRWLSVFRQDGQSISSDNNT